jgi:type IV pilus assembly protein PilW
MIEKTYHKDEPGLTMKNNKGFTIVELLVAMAISLVVMGSIYSVYQTQQKSYIVQEQVTVMQQNLRAGMTMLTRDIRTAGYDPTVSYVVGIELANADELRFTRVNDAWDATETIYYSLSNNDLVRDAGSGAQLVAENIDALDFVYLDANGNVIADPNSFPETISSIQVTMVARAGRVDLDYTDNTTYQNQQSQDIYNANDSYRRRRLTREVNCRNL